MAYHSRAVEGCTQPSAQAIALPLYTSCSSVEEYEVLRCLKATHPENRSSLVALKGASYFELALVHV
jgi:hypothetical protein